MSNSSHIPAGVRGVVLLVLVAVLLFGWSATAYAQTSASAQYGNPAPTVTVSSGSSGGASGGGAATTSVLPATGGPQFSLVALGALALSATGLLVLQRANRR